jgi:hypothetical protein
MTQQYLRAFSCVLTDSTGSGLDFADFNVRFTVRRGDLQTPNSCDVRVYNISDTTANQVQAEFTQIVLQAGYQGDLGVIFRGSVKQYRKGRVDAKDSYLDITAGDGDECYNFAVSAFSLAANTQPKDSLQALIANLVQASIAQQISPPSVMPTLPTNGRVRGRVFYGMTRDELRDFCQSYGLKWSIQDGTITFIPYNRVTGAGGYLPGPIPVISPDTGLIGVPEQTQNGIEMRVLLNPRIKIGQLVQLKSPAVNLNRYGLDSDSQAHNLALRDLIKTNADGLYYVMAANHTGETRGNDWYTDLTCLATDATITGASPLQPALPISALPNTGVITN